MTDADKVCVGWTDKKKSNFLQMVPIIHCTFYLLIHRSKQFTTIHSFISSQTDHTIFVVLKLHIEIGLKLYI